MIQVSGFKYRVSSDGRSSLILFIVSIYAGVLLMACSNAQSDVPAMEQRAQALNRSIMCPVCPGESIDQSQVALAVQMRGIVNEKLAEGWSDEQVREFFVERYGHSVLLEPPTEGVSLAVWLLPPVGVAVAIASFILVLRRMRRTQPTSTANQAQDTMTDEDLQSYYERIEASVSGTSGDGQDIRDG